MMLLDAVAAAVKRRPNRPGLLSDARLNCFTGRERKWTTFIVLIVAQDRGAHRRGSRHHELHRLRGAADQRVDPGPARTQPGRARWIAPTDRRCREISTEGRLHAGARKQLLLLARPLPGDDARDHHPRGGPVRQHAFRRPDGHRRHQRRDPLRLRDRLVRRLRHRDRRLVVELEISISSAESVPLRR